MAMYISLLKFTDQGIRNVKDTTKRAAAGTAEAEKMGIKVTDSFWTMGAYDVVLLLDVIEHLDDDVAGLRAARRCLRDEGLLVVAVPAYPSLWSAHDVALGHRRRYTAIELRRVVELAGGGHALRHRVGVEVRLLGVVVEPAAREGRVRYRVESAGLAVLNLRFEAA